MNAQELPVVTPQEARSWEGEWESRALCACGCKLPAREGSKYFRPDGPGNCRQRLFDLQHPRLDLSGVDAEVCLRIKRMVEEAVRAAKEGVVRATVDARHPVKREKDPRPSCRVRLTEEYWRCLDDLLAADSERRGGPMYYSKSDYVMDLIKDAWRKLRGYK